MQQLPNPKTAQKKNALAAKIILANAICKMYYGASKKFLLQYQPDCPDALAGECLDDVAVAKSTGGHARVTKAHRVVGQHTDVVFDRCCNTVSAG